MFTPRFFHLDSIVIVGKTLSRGCGKLPGGITTPSVGAKIHLALKYPRRGVPMGAPWEPVTRNATHSAVRAAAPPGSAFSRQTTEGAGF